MKEKNPNNATHDKENFPTLGKFLVLGKFWPEDIVIETSERQFSPPTLQIYGWEIANPLSVSVALLTENKKILAILEDGNRIDVPGAIWTQLETLISTQVFPISSKLPNRD